MLLTLQHESFIIYLIVLYFFDVPSAQKVTLTMLSIQWLDLTRKENVKTERPKKKEGNTTISL